MINSTIAELKTKLINKEVSSVELTNFYLDRISKFDPKLNSFISITSAQALAQAAIADKLIAKQESSLLTGIPIAHKDIFCTKDIKTSCGSKMLDNFIAPYDATAVINMQEAGAIMLGKTNMDEFAMGSSNETSYYGAVKNPWDLDCVPGGSSGGSAAAVAARLIPGATGTDTGGSIRQPAALCGITGIKPTYGRVSRYGMIAFASSLDQGGIMAPSASDCAIMLQAMAGFDTKDSTSIDKPVADYSATLSKSIKGLKIGIPQEFFNQDLDATVAKVTMDAIKELEKLGAIIVDISLPNMHLSVPTYYIVAPAECSANLSRYDGIRFGYRCTDPKDLTDLYKRSRSEGFGTEVQRRILTGTYVLSAGYYDAYYIKAQKVRHLISQDFKAAFEKVDIIAGPTTPSTAFKLGEKSNDPVSMYLADIYTIAVNLAGLPGLSAPCGMHNNMPLGLQLIGNYFDEAKILNIAHQYQQVTDFHTRIPAAFK